MSTLIAKRLVNYHSADAKEADWIKSLPIIRKQISSISKKERGLWVGGALELYSDKLLLRTNALNNAFHQDDLPGVSIALAEIEKLHINYKLFMDEMTIKFGAKELKIRCYRAKSFMSQINETIHAIERR